MADKKSKRPTYLTPVGIARYPHLNKPDTRFNAEGEYKADIRVKLEDAGDLIAQLEAIRDEKLAEFEANEKKAKDKIEVASVYTTEFDDEGNETGYVIFKTKLSAVGKDKTGKTWKNEPKLFDAKGNPHPSEVGIWSGTKMIVGGTVNSYAFVKKADKKTGAREIEVGVSLKCRGVQIIELVSGGGQTAESFGFKPREGYVAPAAQAGLGNNADADSDGEPATSDADGDAEF